jgi:hypothetical protein
LEYVQQVFVDPQGTPSANCNPPLFAASNFTAKAKIRAVAYTVPNIVCAIFLKFL